MSLLDVLGLADLLRERRALVATVATLASVACFGMAYASCTGG